MLRETLSFNITNNLNAEIPVSLFGNLGDVNDNSNATTSYQWNVTGFSITNETTVTLQYAPVNSVSFQTVVATFSGTQLQNIVDALNALNIGTFFINVTGGNTFITNYSNDFAYGNLTIVNPSQVATLYYSSILNLASDQFDVYVNAVLQLSTTDPNNSSGTIPVVAGDTILLDFFTSVNLKGTHLFTYDITNGLYLFNTTQTSAVNTGFTFTIQANTSYLVGMED